MIARKYFIVSLATMAVILLHSIPSSAVVKEVTLFPSAAKVTESAKVHPKCTGTERCKAVIILPPQADTESLVVSSDANGNFRIDDIQIKSFERQDDARIADLRKQIAKLKDERKDLQARHQSLEVQIQFWQMQTKAKTKNIADADNLSAAIGRNVKKAYQDKYSVETELEKNDKRSKELQDSLNQAAGKKEAAWEVTLTLSGAVPGEITLIYNYTLGGCGWFPIYRVEAQPGRNRLLFSWDAELWQSSGEDWKQAQVNLATLQPAISVAPRALMPWIIKPRQIATNRSLKKAKAAPAAAMLERISPADEDAVEAPVQEITNTTYSLWSIGKKNVPAGSRQRFKIKEEIWPAEFIYFARPALSPQAFVRAEVKFTKPVEIPSGTATFLIDGAMLGKRNFSLAGSEGILFFGASPFITVTSSTVTDKSGAKTIFQNKQTQKWQWIIEAKNTGNTDVKLRIEEPAPQVRDERIRLTLQQSPEPAEKDHEKFVWIMDLQAMQKKTIQNAVDLEAPKDLDLDLGFRR